MHRLVALVAVAGCSFQGNSNSGDDAVGDDSADDTGDDSPVVDAPPDRPDAVSDPDAFVPASVTETFGERSTCDHTGVTLDTYISSDEPNNSWSTQPTLHMVVDPAGPDDEPAVGLLYFDLSAIPAGATIQWVELDVHTANLDSGGDAVDFYVMNQAWTGGATWEVSGVGDEDWATEGAGPPSRAKDSVATLGESDAETAYTIAIPAAVVQSWVDTPGNNHGFALVGGDNDDVDLRSSDNGTDTDRPQLAVTWQPPS